MKNIKTYSLVLILIFLGLSSSCTKDFEDINRDPLNPTEASIPTVFNLITERLLLGYMEQNGIHNGYYYFITQQLANSSPHYVLEDASDSEWGLYYKMMKNVRWLENELENSELKVDNVKACLNILVAYKTLRMADLFGDMPFSEAGKASEGGEFYRVAYDKHEDIYAYCLGSLKLAAESFSTDEDQMSLGSGDVLFNNDYEMWKKFANSIRLRYAMQLVEVDNAQATMHIGNILGDASAYPLITGDETIGMWPRRLANTLILSRAWSFSAENLTCMGTTMWDMMSDNANVDGSGFFDPRARLFFETNMNDEWVPQPQFNANPINSKGPYLNGTFPGGRDRGQTLQDWENKGTSAHYSSVNYYLTRDDAYLPEIIISVAEVHYLKAEAYNRGVGVSQSAATAQTEYETGITSSINFWYSLVDLLEGTSSWVFQKPVLEATGIADYMAHAKIAYSANASAALNQIYAQAWIDAFRQAWVGFSLYRRTGLTPHDVSGAHENNFYKVPYPESELNNNFDNYNVALGGKSNTPDNKLFWHK